MKSDFTCDLCGKGPRMGFNRPKSQHKTKRTILPNLQKWHGLLICCQCRRTIKKYTPQPVAKTSPNSAVSEIKPAVSEATPAAQA